MARFPRESAGRKLISMSHSKCFSFGKYYFDYQRQSPRQNISMPFYSVSSSHNLAIKSGRASLRLKIFCSESLAYFHAKANYPHKKKLFQEQEFSSTKAGKGGI